MMASPEVSVLMTSYNREKFIGFAIESIQASTFRNWELVITDDGSKDRTVEIVKSYAAEDNRIKLFLNKVNLGDYGNRNQAASHASGKYLKYVDADDYIYPWGLQILVDCMEAHPEAGWGLCSLEQNNDRPFPFQLSPEQAYLYHYKGPGLFHKAPLSSIIRRDAFEAVGGFDPIRMAGDYNMWHKLGQRFNVVLMPAGLVWYRKHDSQEMNHYHKFIGIYESIQMKYLKDSRCPLNEKVVKELLQHFNSRKTKQFLKNTIRLRFADMKSDLNAIRSGRH